MNSTGTHRESEPLLLLNKTLAFIVLIVGASVILFVLIAVIKSKLYKRQIVKLIINLIFTDFCACLVAMTTSLVNSFRVNFEKDIWCRISAFFIYTMIGAECMCITFISLLAFISIIKLNLANVYRKNLKVAIFVLVTIWSVPIVILLFPLSELWGEFRYGNGQYVHVCHPNWESSFGKFIIGLALCLTSSSMIISYIGIFCRIRDSFRKINPSQSKVAKKEQARKQRERQLVLNSSLLVTSFVVLYYPESIISTLDPDVRHVNPYVRVVIYYVSWSHVIVNTLIYALFNSYIRAACKALLTRNHTAHGHGDITSNTAQ